LAGWEGIIDSASPPIIYIGTKYRWANFNSGMMEEQIFSSALI
jgi:hypothetical protein